MAVFPDIQAAQIEILNYTAYFIAHYIAYFIAYLLPIRPYLKRPSEKLTCFGNSQNIGFIHPSRHSICRRPQTFNTTFR
ncbi:hypothetical protein HMPREF9370_1923 [Neisseria wadsworthii 9715]|uniref:Uncharacterized protein n=1 Tax=Neisseria wadsworthii 9715 TaxID=1030841 RepID=G4CS63_9NEIS|nr:hypothetical protein HMPREF9370_1923 [Neisseria wadsworthii 9715]